MQKFAESVQLKSDIETFQQLDYWCCSTNSKQLGWNSLWNKWLGSYQVWWWYAGKVTEVLSKDIVVSVMHHAGKCFKWPDRKDECVYPLEAVVSRINPPVAVAGRLGQFSFDYFNWQNLKNFMKTDIQTKRWMLNFASYIKQI